MTKFLLSSNHFAYKNNKLVNETIHETTVQFLEEDKMKFIGQSKRYNSISPVPPQKSSISMIFMMLINPKTSRYYNDSNHIHYRQSRPRSDKIER